MTDRYDTTRSWEWNLQNAPQTPPVQSEPLVGDWHWCGLAVNSPLGISAGPLLDSRWLLYYANRGFDILVYKTVRSRAHPCYALPNLVPVSTGPLQEAGSVVHASDEMTGSWAVSFGMPSQSPDAWRKDVSEARERLAAGQILVVSVVGTQDQTSASADDSLRALASDFARCAKWAVESGAHGVEANFSCPNVATADGQLFQQPASAAIVAREIRSAIGETPLVLKIGRIDSETGAAEFLQAVRPWINGLAMTNSISARVRTASGDLLFDGHSRGICGDATRCASMEQVRLFHSVQEHSPRKIDLIGVGGISTSGHVREYLAAGAASVAMATSVMTDPDVARRIRSEWAQCE